MSAGATRIRRLSRLDLAVGAGGWPEVAPFRPEIDAAFAALTATNPHIWNGRILLLRDHEIRERTLHGACIETDFAAFNWWRKRGRDDLGVKNIFGFAAVEGADGAFLMGVMGDHTASPGRIYFAGGTPEPQDVVDDRLDLRGSAVREMREEIGLSEDRADEADGWDLVEHGLYFGLMRRMRFSRPAAALAAEARAFLAREVMPELKDVHIIASEQDIVSAVVPFAADYVRWRWAEG
ncbi:MAG: NUDIX hydrolase [Pseudomonadota bacterium]